VLDSKALISDLYKLLDNDNNNVISLTEFINNHLLLFETMGVKIKPEFKETVSQIAEMIKMSNRAEIVIPKRIVK
jgi:outer membrane protein OmpA-like peptidoglycan-associated protein